MNPERALAWALDYNGIRRGRPLTDTAIQRADRAMRSVLRSLAWQSDCSVTALVYEDIGGGETRLEGWYRGAGECGDPETCRAAEWYWQRASLVAAAIRVGS